MRWKTAHARRRRRQLVRAADRAFAASLVKHVVDLFGLSRVDMQRVQASVALAVATGGAVKVLPALLTTEHRVQRGADAQANGRG